MAKKKEDQTENGKGDKKGRVRWLFPRAALEQALKIAYAIKDYNGGNPWTPEEIRKAIGASTGGNAYFYLTAASRDYQLTVGTSAAEKIEFTELGRDLVYAPTPRRSASLSCAASSASRSSSGFSTTTRVATSPR